MPQTFYFDNNTCAKISEKTVSKMIPFFSEKWGVLSVPHSFGQQLFAEYASNLKFLYAFIGAKEEDAMILTSSGTEAVNQIFLSQFYETTRSTGKNQYIAANIDEAPALLSINRLEDLGCIGKLVNANSKGFIDPSTIEESITPRTALVSLSWANALTGVINPVSEIGQICQDRGVHFHVDATQVLGKLFFELEDIGVNFLTFNGDQLHAPRGSGMLYIKAQTPCSPLLVGGMEQGGLRAGSVNLANLAGFAHAAKECLESRDLLCTEVARLRNHFEQMVLKTIPESCVFFPDQERLPHCTAIGFQGVSNEALLYLLNRKGVYACIGGGNNQQIGLVLMASGVEENLAHSALSFSFSRETTQDEIEKAVAILEESVLKLRKMSNQLIKKIP